MIVKGIKGVKGQDITNNVGDVVIRRAIIADAPVIAAVRIDSWRATYRGIIPDDYLDGMKVEDSTAIWSRILSATTSAANVFVAEQPFSWDGLDLQEAGYGWRTIRVS